MYSLELERIIEKKKVIKNIFFASVLYVLFDLIEILNRWLFLSAFYFWWCGLHVFELLLGFFL